MDADRAKQLQEFADYAAKLKGDEKGEAQVFLDRLFRAFSRGGVQEAGATLEQRVKNDRGGTSFADLVWKPHVLIEMKKRGEDLSTHLTQAFDYWVKLVPNRPRYVVLCNFDEFRVYDFDKDINEPQDTVTLAELPERYGPLNFLWPTNEKPKFRIDREKVTREAADILAAVYKRLAGRKDVGPARAQRFALQCLVCFFSEDIGLLPKQFFTTLLDECIDPPKAFDLFDGLFRAMNAKSGAKGGRFKDVAYFNGGIFAESAAVELDPEHEVAMLKNAATYKWNHISPDIFGTIFQHSMEAKERHAFGAHYTSPTDIMKIVRPTIVEPFTKAIDAADSLKQLTELRDRLTTLRVLDPACGSGNFLYIAYREMRRLEASIILKQSQMSKRAATGQGAFSGVSPRQFFGMDILPFAVELAKVTLSLAPKLASDELHTTEPTLPLFNLDANVRVCDALIDEKGGRSLWPQTDVIIGNPPFLGAKRLKPERGADYVNAVRDAYPEVPGMADYCVYWFRRAHDHLPAATKADPFKGRAGLVGTQNIRNNQSRVGGLDHIVKSGVIVEAVDNQPWSGEANVHVSIANWVKTHEPNDYESSAPTGGEGTDGADCKSVAQSTKRGRKRSDAADSKSAALGKDARDLKSLAKPEPINEAAVLIPEARKLWYKVDPKSPLFEAEDPSHQKVVTAGKRGKTRIDKSYELAFIEKSDIGAALTARTEASAACVLSCNEHPQRCFTGQMIGHDRFLLSQAEKRAICAADAKSAHVIFRHLNGREFLSDGGGDRFVIDFGAMDQLEAARYKGAIDWVERHVLPDRKAAAESGKDSAGRQRSHHKQFLSRWWQLAFPRPELIGQISAKKRFAVCSRVTKRPVFVFVSSTIRPGDALSCFAFDDDYSFGILQSDAHWQWFVAKCSKLTERFRYSPESVFDTFPWPQSPTKKQINAVAAAGREIRAIRDKVLPTMTGGLRALYRTLELPGKNPLKDAHAALDAAVLEAYGFSAKKDLLKQLLDLNLSVAAAIEKGEDVTGPGVPKSYGDAKGLVTEDCIRP
ncbi:MAG TPA: DNA methyltransferase [Phycisphaerales bacterium]